MLDTAIAIVFKDNAKQLLLTKRDDIPIWVLPGGGIDPGESPEAAVCRELFEETGYQGKILRKTAYYTSQNKLSKNVHVFELEIVGGHLVKSEESPEVGFFSVEKLPSPFFLLHQDWLKDAQLNSSKTIEGVLKTSYGSSLWYGLRNPQLMWYFLLTRIRLLMRCKERKG